jgi:hypothetical protein
LLFTLSLSHTNHKREAHETKQRTNARENIDIFYIKEAFLLQRENIQSAADYDDDDA